MNKAITFESQLGGQNPKLSKTLVGGAELHLLSVAQKSHHDPRPNNF
jgi:hypothetical protein